MKEELLKYQDLDYAKLQTTLVPNIDSKTILGIRFGDLRKIAKNYLNDQDFLNDLPHKYLEENIIHTIIISNIKDYDTCIKEIKKFLPYMDNWVVTDTISPKIFNKKQDLLIEEIKTWLKSKHPYTIRVALLLLKKFYLGDAYNKDCLLLASKVKHDDYYVKMMLAWFYCDALIKHWDDAITYLENNTLDVWVHNKTIQKARESFRISDEQKEYLKSLKRV